MARRKQDSNSRKRAKAEGRHGRRRSRFTPRRWLPFLALVALTAGAVVLVGRGDEPLPAQDSPRRIAARLPVASAANALSTAWYCGGGTARGEGPAEMTIVIANESSQGAQAEVTAVDPDGAQVVKSVDVPARGNLRLVASDVIEARWVAMTVEVFGGRSTVSREVVGPHGFDQAPCATEGADRWYVPSGSTIRGATEVLMLYNPYSTATSVDVTFATDEGPRNPRALRGLSIPPGSFRLVASEELPARRPEVATTVVARTGRVIVDRVQIYDGSGDPAVGSGDEAAATPAPEGLVSTAAASTVSARWVFPDAQVGTDARLQVAIFNPGRETAEIDVVIAYEDPDRAPIIEPLPVTVRGGEERILDLTDSAEIALDTPFSIDLRSLQGVPVVAEQLSFGAVPPVGIAAEPATGSDGSQPAEAPPADPGEDPAATPGAEDPAPSAGLAISAGSPIAATTWFLAQYGASEDRAVALVVANPGAEAVTVRVDSFEKGSRTKLDAATIEVPPGDRRRLDIGDVDGSSALLVIADGPVVTGQVVVAIDGVGISSTLLMPWPETVVALPAVPLAGS